MDPQFVDNPQNDVADMFALAERLWPLNRSLTGDGVRQTIQLLAEVTPELKMIEVASGTAVFDWEIPKEWRVSEAFIETPSGERICDFSRNNLHLVGYSVPFSGFLALEELQNHLYSLPEQPNAIPYVTSYYEENWGFCISEDQRSRLESGIYRVKIDSELFDGSLSFGELVIEGTSSQEILFSTYICHPSMANNELSGPVLASQLAKFVRSKDRYFTYRFVFIPETIGSLLYLQENLHELKKSLLAGFVLTCVGDDRGYSYVPSRGGNTVADRMALRVAAELELNIQKYSWLDRGSDERQYCSPGIDLPVCSVMRSKYGAYPEYHTSLDRLGTVVTRDGLGGSLRYYRALISAFEGERFPRTNQLGEPQLGRRGLYPNLSQKAGFPGKTRLVLDILSLSDGRTSITEMQEILEVPMKTIEEILELLAAHELVTI